jgi:hypothetical protein
MYWPVLALETDGLDRRRLDIGLVVVGIPLVGLYSRFNVDDPFITFRYAWNFANGHGLVFNPGERILGTTSPLFAILLGWVSDSVESIPRIADAASGIALIGVALLLSRIIARDTGESKPVASLVAPLFVLTSPLLGEAQGFELNLFLVLVLGGIWAHLGDRAGWAGLLIAAATLFRGDGFVPAVMIGAHLLWSGTGDWRRFAAAFTVPLAGFALLAWVYYGAPLPNTLAAKRAMGESGLWRGTLYGGARLAVLYVLQSPLYALLAPLIGAGLWRLWRGGMASGTALIFAWTTGVLLAYTMMGIPSAFNYYGPLVPVVGIILGIGTQVLTDRFDSRKGIVSGVVVLVCLAQLWPSRSALGADPNPRYVAYRECAEQLAQMVRPDQTVAMVEIGILSYFSGRRILDLVGLVHPEIGPHLAEGDVSWPVRERKPQFVLLHDPPWPSIETGLVETDWFGMTYTRQKTFEAPEPYRLVLYNRVKP